MADVDLNKVVPSVASDDDRREMISLNVLELERLAAELPEPYYLSPLDHCVASTLLLSCVFVYEAPSRSPCSEEAAGEDMTTPYEKVAAALKALLKYYPHMGGRLSIVPGRPMTLNDFGHGIELTYRRDDRPLSAFRTQNADDMGTEPAALSVRSRYLERAFPERCNELLPRDLVTVEEICSQSVLRVRFTEFACGGFALGFTTSHVVEDACGFFQMISNFAELYNHPGEPDFELSRPPVNERYMRVVFDKAERTSSPVPPSQHLTLLKESAGDWSAMRGVATSDCSGETFRFSKACLAELKAEATAPDSETTGAWITTYDALAAHVFRYVHDARVKALAATVETDGNGDHDIASLRPLQFLLAINLRSGTNARTPSRPMLVAAAPTPGSSEFSGISQTYTGNAIICGSDTITELDLSMKEPLWKLAAHIHDVSRKRCKASTEEIEKTCRWVGAQPDLSLVTNNYEHSAGSLLTSQWYRFDAYELATLHKRPCFVCQPFSRSILVDGLAYFLFTETAGDVDISLSLKKEVWPYFNLDGCFVRTSVPSGKLQANSGLAEESATPSKSRDVLTSPIVNHLLESNKTCDSC